MCGIIGFTGKDNAVPKLLDGLASLEYRGYDSAGIAFFENGETDVIKSRGKLTNLREKISGLGRQTLTRTVQKIYI